MSVQTAAPPPAPVADPVPAAAPFAGRIPQAGDRRERAFEPGPSLLLERRWAAGSQMVRLSVLDAWRAKGLLFVSVLTVAGVCLPSLLLWGLKRGMVEQFRQEMLRSPTATEVLASVVADPSLRLDAAGTAELAGALPAAVIPDLDDAVAVVPPRPADGSEPEDLSARLISTAPGDRKLAFHGADVLAADELGVVISADLAAALGWELRREPDGRAVPVQANPTLRVRLTRGGEAGPEASPPIRLPVRAALAGPVDRPIEAAEEGAEADAGGPRFGTEHKVFASAGLLRRTADYAAGLSVPDLGLAGNAREPQPAHDGYLLFTKADRGADLTADDRARLDQLGFVARPLDEALPDLTPAERAEVRTLYGLLRPHELGVWWVGVRFAGRGGAVRTLPSDRTADWIAGVTPLDDAVVPWSRPRVAEIDGEPHRLVGLSPAGGRWFKTYLVRPGARFAEGGDGMRVFLPESDDATTAAAPAEGEAAEPPPAVTVADGPVSYTLAAQPPAARGRFPAEPPGPTDRERALFAAAARTVTTLHLGLGMPGLGMPGLGGVGLGGSGAAADADGWAEAWAASPVRAAWAEAGRLPVAVVPSRLTALLARRDAGQIAFDPDRNRFAPLPTGPVYGKFRVYAPTLESVPEVHAALEARGYSATSDRDGVQEMLGNVRRLTVMCWATIVPVLLLGVLSIGTGLYEVAQRKRKELGVLRLIGAGQAQAVWFVLIRAVLLAALASVVTACVAALAVAGLGSIGIDCRIRWPLDLPVMFLVALLCCLIGAAFAAWRCVARVDPFEAIEGGRAV